MKLPRLGLCCLFRREPIRFRTTTASVLRRLDRRARLEKASRLCLANAEALLAAVEAVARLGIGAFRIKSDLFPRCTHPEVGYRIDELPDGRRVRAVARLVREAARRLDIRLSLHPDQFVVLSSASPRVLESSLRELESQALQAEWFGAEVLTIHGGGAEGGKEPALDRLRAGFRLLSRRARERLCLENDDTVYTPRDLLPVCADLGIPLVYDVHHHRCLPDGMDAEQAARAAARTWLRLGREPVFHVSSPREGWRRGSPKPHADYINPSDFPKAWLRQGVTVDIEAKAKEVAVLRLMRQLNAR